MRNEIKELSQTELTIGKTYFALIDECMGGYPAGVLKLTLTESSDAIEKVSRYEGSSLGYVEKDIQVNTSHFQVDQILKDLEGSYVGSEKLTFKWEEGDSLLVHSYVEATDEALEWIKETTGYFMHIEDVEMKLFLTNKYWDDLMNKTFFYVGRTDIADERSRTPDYRSMDLDDVDFHPQVLLHEVSPDYVITVCEDESNPNTRKEKFLIGRNSENEIFYFAM